MNNVIIYFLFFGLIANLSYADENAIIFSILQNNYKKAGRDLPNVPRLNPLIKPNPTQYRLNQSPARIQSFYNSSLIDIVGRDLAVSLNAKIKKVAFDPNHIKSQIHVFTNLVSKLPKNDPNAISLEIIMRSHGINAGNYIMRKDEALALWGTYLQTLDRSAYEFRGKASLLDYLIRKRAFSLIPIYFNNLRITDSRYGKISKKLDPLYYSKTRMDVTRIVKPILDQYRNYSDILKAAFYFYFPHIVTKVKNLDDLKKLIQLGKQRRLILDVGERFQEVFYDVPVGKKYKFRNKWINAYKKLKPVTRLSKLNVEITAKRLKRSGLQTPQPTTLYNLNLGKLTRNTLNRVNQLPITILTEAELKVIVEKIKNDKNIDLKRVDDGCYKRAAQISTILAQNNIYNLKVFSIARWGGEEKIRVNWGSKNPFSKALNTLGLGKNIISWWYHVAPLVAVRKDFQNINRASNAQTAMGEKIELYVIDLNLFPGRAVPLITWLNEQLTMTGSMLSQILIEGRGVVSPQRHDIINVNAKMMLPNASLIPDPPHPSD